MSLSSVGTPDSESEGVESPLVPRCILALDKEASLADPNQHIQYQLPLLALARMFAMLHVTRPLPTPTPTPTPTQPAEPQFHNSRLWSPRALAPANATSKFFFLLDLFRVPAPSPPWSRSVPDSPPSSGADVLAVSRAWWRADTQFCNWGNTVSREP